MEGVAPYHTTTTTAIPHRHPIACLIPHRPCLPHTPSPPHRLPHAACHDPVQPPRAAVWVAPQGGHTPHRLTLSRPLSACTPHRLTLTLTLTLRWGTA